MSTKVPSKSNSTDSDLLFSIKKRYSRHLMRSLKTSDVVYIKTLMKKVTLCDGVIPHSNLITQFQLLHSKFGEPGKINTEFKPGHIEILLRSISAYF